MSRSSNSPRYFEPAEHRADVERPDPLALQALGHIAGDDSLRKPLDDRGLADAGVADQHRVVLRAAGKHLDHPADLLVATDHGVELPLLGELGQVAAELLQCLVGALGILRGDALAAAHLRDLLQQSVAGDDVEREQQVLGRDVVVLELLGLVGSAVEHARERRADLRLLLRSLGGRLGVERRFGLRAQLGRVGNQLLRQLLVEQRQQQVLGVELGVAHAARELLGGGDRLLRFQRQLVEVHRL